MMAENNIELAPQGVEQKPAVETVMPGSSSSDVSAADKEAGTQEPVALKRNLRGRHIQMIAIGAVLFFFLN